MVAVEQKNLRLFAFLQGLQYAICKAVHGNEEPAGAHLPVNLIVESADMLRLQLVGKPFQFHDVIAAGVLYRVLSAGLRKVVSVGRFLKEVALGDPVVPVSDGLIC